MTKKRTSGIQRGQAITFRLPSDTPDHIIKELQKIREVERRNFSSKIASFVLQGVSNSLAKERETITIPLPKQLSKEQRNWIRHSHSEAMLGSIVYQLLADPIRATSILASLNSNAIDIDDALYLQEDESVLPTEEVHQHFETSSEISEPVAVGSIDAADNTDEDDLMNFDWNKAIQEQSSAEEPQEDEADNDTDPLADFLNLMNK